MAFDDTRTDHWYNTVDVELAAKFQDELGLETENGDTEQLPESIQYFLDNGPFEVRLIDDFPKLS